MQFLFGNFNERVIFIHIILRLHDLLFRHFHGKENERFVLLLLY